MSDMKESISTHVDAGNQSDASSIPSQSPISILSNPRQPNLNERLGHAEPPKPETLFDPDTLQDFESMQAQFEAESLRVFNLKKQYELSAKNLYTMEQYIKNFRASEALNATTLSSDNQANDVSDESINNISTIKNQIEDAEQQSSQSEEQSTDGSIPMPKFVLSAAKRACVRKAVRIIDDHLLTHVCIVLVRTEGAVNIGQICRFAANIGVTDIRLVNPICNPLSSDGRRFAHHALPLLSSLPTYDSVDTALADCDVVVGTSARDCAAAHRGCKFIEPQDIAGVCVSEQIWGPGVESEASSNTIDTNADEITLDSEDGKVEGIQRKPKREFLSSSRRVAILFGNEASGLNHEELARANYCVYIPTRGAYPSLNLAHAVTVVLFSVWLTGHKRNFAPKLEGESAGNTNEVNNISQRIATSQESLNESGHTGRHVAKEHVRPSRTHIERARALFEATMHRFGLKSAVNRPDYFHEGTLRLARMCTLSASDLNLFTGAMRAINTKVDQAVANTAEKIPSLEEEKFLLGDIIKEEKAIRDLEKENMKQDKVQESINIIKSTTTQ